MEYLFLILLFLFVGTVALKATEVIKNLIHLVLLILLGAVVWYNLIPYLFGEDRQIAKEKVDELVGEYTEYTERIVEKAPDILEDVRRTEKQLSDEAKQKGDVERLLAGHMALIPDVVRIQKQLKSEWLSVVKQRVEQTKSQLKEKLIDAVVPDLPTKETLETMTSDQKRAVTEQLITFFDALPRTEVQEQKPEPAPSPDQQPTTLLLQAEFQDEFSVDKASGFARVYRLPDGSHVLRLEDFSMTSGPDMAVYVSVSPIGDIDRGFVDLGPLKAAEGSHNYVMTTHASPFKFKTVILFSRSLQMPYAIAPLLTVD